MTPQKKLIYQMEDTFTLGKSLPIVAMRQMPKLAEKFRATPDLPEHPTGSMNAMADNIDRFYRENKQLLDDNDERELFGIFNNACKSKQFSNSYFRMVEAIKSLLP